VPRTSIRSQPCAGIDLLALDEDAAVGFTQLYPSFSSGAAAPILILNDLFVVPSARRCGVATSLLRAAVEAARAAGAVRLTLSTEIVNEAARQLYEREGWTLQADFCVYNLALT
jgi:GNAT superfamily N-acetyltransferase